MAGEPEEKNTLLGVRDIPGVREMDKLFTTFRRYTKFVFVSKWFLGVFALLLMVSMIAWPLLSRDRAGIRITFTGTETDGSKKIASPVMENPEYEGTDAQNQQFKLTGLRAIQRTPDLVEIQQVNGQLIKLDDSWVGLTSEKAEYVQKENRVELMGNVTISNDAGYVFTTPSAHIDTKTMHVTGKEHVEGVGPQGKLVATGFEIGDNGSVIRFGGKERVKMQLDQMRGKK